MKQYVKQVAFLQGDDAREIFNIMYPVGNKNGDRHTIRKAHDAMIEYIDDDESYEVEFLPDKGYTGYLNTKYFVMQWNYPYNWVALYRKVYKKDLVSV